MLLTPIGSANDVYLIGYLMVKQLWRNGARFYPELQNADVFMMFLRRFVYGDHALVRDLLDRGENPFARALRFARNLYARLHALRMMLFEDEVPWSEWERLLGPPPLEQRPGFALSDSVPFAALDTQEESEDGMRMLSRELTEVSRPLELADSELGEHIPKDHFANVVRERYLMWAGTAGARWISLGPRKGRVMVGDAVFVEDYDLTEASDEGLDELTADIYFDLYEGYRLTTLGGDDGVFGFVSDRPLSEWARRELRSTRLDRRRIAVLDDVVREVLIRYADHTSFREGMEGFWQDGARERLEGSYTQIAFDFDDAARDAVIGRGFAGLFDADPDLVRTVTAISIAASARMSPERLAHVCPQLVLPPRDAIERVRSLWPGRSPAPVGEDGDGFLTSTI